MASRYRFQPNKTSNPIPVTIALIIAIAFGFILSWIPQPGQTLIKTFAFWFDSPQLWQFVTFPFVTNGNGYGLLTLIIELLLLYRFGGEIERLYRAKTLLFNLFGATFGAACLGLIGSKFMLTPESFLADSYFSISYIVVLGCARKPEEAMSFWGLPFKHKWFALINVVFVLIGYGSGAPIFGLIICIPLLFAWLYGQNKIPGITFGKNIISAKAEKKKDNREFDEFRSKVLDK